MRLIPAAAALSALFAILGQPALLAQPLLVWVFKPLTSLLILVAASGRGPNLPGDESAASRRRWILAGLALSLIGDIALLWPQQGFLPGLVSFLLAHLAYIAGFTRGQRLARPAWPLAVYGVIAACILALLWPGVPSALRVPVLAYVAALATMAAQTACFARSRRAGPDARPAAGSAVGGALFVVSDGLLATDRFAQPLALGGPAILASYWIAQWLISAAIGRLPAKAAEVRQT